MGRQGLDPLKSVCIFHTDLFRHTEYRSLFLVRFGEADLWTIPHVIITLSVLCSTVLALLLSLSLSFSFCLSLSPLSSLTIYLSHCNEKELTSYILTCNVIKQTFCISNIKYHAVPLPLVSARLGLLWDGSDHGYGN